MAVRNLDKANEVIREIKEIYPTGSITAKYIDTSKLSTVKEFAKDFIGEYDQLDVLINNAGIMMVPFSKTEDGFESQMGTNHLGHFALTGLLLPVITKTENSRIVNLSSGAQNLGSLNMLDDLNFENTKYNKNKAYGNSKLSNMLFSLELKEKLKGSSTKVTIAHPGWTNTPLQDNTWLKPLNRFFAIEVEQGCLSTLRAAFDENAQSGDYFGPEKKGFKQRYPAKDKGSKAAYNKEAARKLWTLSEQLTGIKY